MAGKELKAKARTVQKMSRNGLVEENLRTGSRRMAGRVSDPGERIGDRPMEDYKAGNSSGQAAQEDRNLRLSRRGADAEHVDGNRRWESGNDAVKDAGIYGDSVSSGVRLKNAKYTSALRKERGSGREGKPAKEERLTEGNLHRADKKAVMRGKTADQDENGALLHKGDDFEESGISEEESTAIKENAEDSWTSVRSSIGCQVSIRNPSCPGQEAGL